MYEREVQDSLLEEHREHHLVGLFGKIGEEEDLVWEILS